MPSPVAAQWTRTPVFIFFMAALFGFAILNRAISNEKSPAHRGRFFFQSLVYGLPSLIWKSNRIPPAWVTKQVGLITTRLRHMCNSNLAIAGRSPRDSNPRLHFFMAALFGFAMLNRVITNEKSRRHRAGASVGARPPIAAPFH